MFFFESEISNILYEAYHKSPCIGRTFLLPILPLKIQCPQIYLRTIHGGGLSAGIYGTCQHLPSKSGRFVVSGVHPTRFKETKAVDL